MVIRSSHDYTELIGLVTVVIELDPQIRKVYGPGVDIIKTGTKVRIVGWRITNKNSNTNLQLRIESTDGHQSIWYPYNFIELPEDDQE